MVPAVEHVTVAHCRSVPMGWVLLPSSPSPPSPQPCGAELWHDAMERTVNSLAESANAAQQQQAELVQDLAAANVEMNGLLTHIMEM
jgi:hypothetical protein